MLTNNLFWQTKQKEADRNGLTSVDLTLQTFTVQPQNEPPDYQHELGMGTSFTLITKYKPGRKLPNDHSINLCLHHHSFSIYLAYSNLPVKAEGPPFETGFNCLVIKVYQK